MYLKTVRYTSVVEDFAQGRKRLTREESRALTRERLLDSAFHLFTSQGVEATSIEHITEHAGYSRGAFYGNFSSKEEVLGCLLERTIVEETSRMRAVFAEPKSPLELFQQVRAVYLDFSADKRKCMFWMESYLYALRHPEYQPRMVELVRRDRQEVNAITEELFRVLGVHPPIPGPVLIAALISLTQGLCLQQMLDPEVITQEFMLGTQSLIFDSLLADTARKLDGSAGEPQAGSGQ